MRAVARIVQIGVVVLRFVAVVVMTARFSVIRPGFRLERRFGVGDAATETPDHFSENVIGLEQQSSAIAVQEESAPGHGGCRGGRRRERRAAACWR